MRISGMILPLGGPASYSRVGCSLSDCSIYLTHDLVYNLPFRPKYTRLGFVLVRSNLCAFNIQLSILRRMEWT